MSDLEKMGSNPKGANKTTDIEQSSIVTVDPAAEKSYVRKLDLRLLPFLSLMYFCNSLDRGNISNAETDGLSKDLHFVGQEYSLLLLLFYIPNGFLDLPLNLLTKRFSGKWVLSSLCLAWGVIATLQAVAKNFAGMLILRLIIGSLEAGFFAGTVFYLSLFYTRNELAFRIALYFGSAVVAAAFSGLLAFGVFQIKSSLYGWQYLFIIEGVLTVVVGLFAFYWLPATPSHCRWLTEAEHVAARVRMLRDGSRNVDEKFNFREAMSAFKGWKMGLYAIISFTYAMGYTTTSTFLPQIVGRLGFDTVKTNLWTVAPNCVGVVILLCVTKSSDYFRERTFHLVFAMSLTLIGLIILASIDVLAHKAVAYFAMFLMAGGAYIPSCIVHTWHNSNSLGENQRAAVTGVFVGLGNLSGIVSSATFRTNYAPKYLPTLIATAISLGICICCTLFLGLWMKADNRRRNKEQGVNLGPGDVDTEGLTDGEKSPQWRWSA
ncbi:hypothetical protein EG329_010166 [Mollisiaceae sp. DMI_Dod_QoI]|nr:hypothetical protein EG329_010166 [Helotiales sp. DMI_Dod_QoI]